MLGEDLVPAVITMLLIVVPPILIGLIAYKAKMEKQ